MKLLWQQIPSPVITEIFCSSPFDGVVLDLEHGHFNNETLYSCIQVGTLLNKTILARVSHLDKQVIRMCLDANISGIILSTVETFDQAKEFYDYCIYPFKSRKDSFNSDQRGVIRNFPFIETGGVRGQGLVRENLWGQKNLKLRKPIIIPQIETKKGVDNIDDISKINFNYYLVGPYDLSASLGDVGNFECKSFKDSMDKLKIKVGDKLGLHIPSKLNKQYEKVKDYNLLALGMDTTFLIESINTSGSLIGFDR
tara:strand:- start:481 stop:1242 length:762 start_codon:yes stop_codon:yes gene_type:complete